jgi:FKBP-type peptidyl-prolyl cis-trans isomerase 2
MMRIQQGSRVTLSYIGTLDNGRIFDDTREQGPLEFTVGCGEVFPALEKALTGMGAGEVKTVVIQAAEAYGQRRTENIITLERQLFPAGKEIMTGQKLSMEFANGETRVMLVTAVNESNVTLDGNHPLAGMELTFALKVDQVE